MLKKLTLHNFTTFENAEFNFSTGINIIIGENSSGKSHVLKLAYSIATIWNQCGLEGWRELLINKLHGVFKIDDLMELKNRQTLLNENIKQTVTLDFFIDDENKVNESISFDLIKRDKLSIKEHPNKPLLSQPLFFPAKEVLSLFSNFTTLYEKYALSFDETYYDLCKAIDNPLLKNPNEDLILKIEPILGGKIILKANNFYLQTPKGEFNIFMIAEGLRKFGMLSYLIANDSLKKNNIIFWDEPEANLNPKLIKQLASFLVELTKYNIQIIIATHNLFLMKYFDYLINHSDTKIPTTFFSLVNSGQGTQVEQSERLSQLNSITALDEELALYDKEQQAIYANM